MSEYTLHIFMSNLELLKPYVFGFDTIKRIESYKEKSWEADKKKEENKVEEITEEPVEDDEGEEDEPQEETKDPEEEEKAEAGRDEDWDRFLLPGFEKLNVSLKFMSGNLPELYTKSKY